MSPQKNGRPESLSPDELEYHSRVVAQFQGATGAFETWAAHLRQKYRLGPQDGIDAAGMIRRVEQPEQWADPLETAAAPLPYSIP